MMVGCETNSELTTSLASSAVSFISDAITILLESLIPSAS
jgi:hypothetical protein